MDRCRHRQAWRSARLDRPQPRSAPARRGHGRARLFLSLPRPIIPSPPPASDLTSARSGSSEAALRLLRAGRSVSGTPAEAYLRGRAITAKLDWLRFHPSVYYRANERAELELWPALLAAVTGLDGTISGVQRTWLDRGGIAKSPLADPRRALGCLLGNGIRFDKDDRRALGQSSCRIRSSRFAAPALCRARTIRHAPARAPAPRCRGCVRAGVGPRANRLVGEPRVQIVGAEPAARRCGPGAASH